MRCDNCGWNYPIRLLNTFTGGSPKGRVFVPECCGICALALKNQLHGIDLKQFDEPHAERLRQDALAWRAKHPEDAPRHENQA